MRRLQCEERSASGRELNRIAPGSPGSVPSLVYRDPPVPPSRIPMGLPVAVKTNPARRPDPVTVRAARRKAPPPIVGDRLSRRFRIEDVYPVRRRRPLSGQADRRRSRRGLGRHLSRRARRQRGRRCSGGRSSDTDWQRAPMRHHRTTAGTARSFPPELGRYVFAIEAWTDTFATWRREVLLKRDGRPERRRCEAQRGPRAARVLEARRQRARRR